MPEIKVTIDNFISENLEGHLNDVTIDLYKHIDSFEELEEKVQKLHERVEELEDLCEVKLIAVGEQPRNNQGTTFEELVKNNEDKN